MATFSPPAVVEHAHTGIDTLPIFSKMPLDYGTTVLKFGTSYRTVRFPKAEDLAAADVIYLGGHTYPITDAEAASLTAAGYQVTT